MVTVVTIDLEARRRQERRRNFYAFGVVTLFSALMGWNYLDNLFRFYAGQPPHTLSAWQLPLHALFYDLCLRLHGFAQTQPPPFAPRRRDGATMATAIAEVGRGRFPSLA